MHALLQVATVKCAILVPIPWCYFHAFLHTSDKVAVTFGDWKAHYLVTLVSGVCCILEVITGAYSDLVTLASSPSLVPI